MRCQKDLRRQVPQALAKVATFSSKDLLSILQWQPDGRVECGVEKIRLLEWVSTRHTCTHQPSPQPGKSTLPEMSMLMSTFMYLGIYIHMCEYIHSMIRRIQEEISKKILRPAWHPWPSLPKCQRVLEYRMVGYVRPSQQEGMGPVNVKLSEYLWLQLL